MLTRGVCEFKMGGRYAGDGTTCDDAPCDELCAGDFNRDGMSNVQDILFVLDGFGTTFDVNDLLAVIGDYGCTG